MMQRDINITIKIEGTSGFTINIPLEQEAKAKEAQNIVNYIFKSWKEKLPSLSNLDLMARIAFHLARKFEEINSELAEVDKQIANCEKKLDDILLELDVPVEE